MRWVEWWRLWHGQPSPSVPSRVVLLRGQPACPHCTNLYTLSLHCHDDRCGWTQCTCGALIYAGRRHRHPRHGSRADTCHDPVAAA
jgi:hypothetical protein